MLEFETVHTVTDYYDGPRGGIADYRGEPVIYESQFANIADDVSDLFRLSPVPAGVFELALEDWAIWLRWEQAFHHGEATRESHPCLPAERERHNELQKQLDGLLKIDAENTFFAEAEFRIQYSESWSGYGWRPLEVRWTRK